MVAFPEASVVDVALVVEDTALGSTSIQDIKNHYLVPALEHFNGGPAAEAEFASLSCSSSYTLVPFRASDCMPEPPARILGPYTSIRKLMAVFDTLAFTGGRGDTLSSGQEGLAGALEAFQEVDRCRGRDTVVSARHILYVCNSPCYDMPIIENVPFNGKTLDELVGVLVERSVQVSLFTPRRLPFFYKLYEKCGGDLAAAKEKNYARDPRHLVLLRGFGLQERPLATTQAAPPNTCLVTQAPPGPQAAPRGPAPGPLQVQQARFPGQPGPQPGGPIGPGKQLPPQQPAGASRMQQGNSTLASLLNRPPQVIGQPGLAQPGGQQPGLPQQGGMQQPNIQQPSIQQNPQQMQQQKPPQQGLPHSPALTAQPGMLGGLQGPQGGVQQGPAGRQGGQVPGQVPPQTREREVIWKGELEWQEKVKDGPGDQKISHSVACSVSTSKEGGVPEVKPDNWPSKLIMQLIPKTLVQTIGGEYFRNSKSVLFHPNDCESLEALTKVMGTGFAGCVHFTGPCDIKVLILLYSNDKKAYLGFIPNDQTSFVDRIRTVIQRQKMGQQQQQPGARPMGPGQGMMGPGMQMMGPGQQAMMGGQMMMGQGQVMPGQQGMMGQRMQTMMGPGGGPGGMPGQQQIVRGGPGMGQGQYVRMAGGPQGGMGPGQRMMGHQGMAGPGLRQILQQQPGMVQGGGVMMQQGMQGQQGMMMQQRPGMAMQGQQGMMPQGGAVQGGMMPQQGGAGMMPQGGAGQQGMMPQTGAGQQNDPMLRELLN